VTIDKSQFPGGKHGKTELEQERASEAA
jgi:hypothetical protein